MSKLKDQRRDIHAMDLVGAERALAERGATALPDPPLEYPPWLDDLRAHWNDQPRSE